MFHRFFTRLVVSFLLLVIFGIRFTDNTLSVPVGEHPLMAGWSTLGISAEEVGVECWKKINNQFNDLKLLERKATALGKRLHLRTDAGPVKGEERDFAYLNLDGALPGGGRMVVTLQSVKSGTEGETHCGIIGFMAPPDDLRYYLRRLERDLTAIIGDIILNVTISGKRQGRVNEAEARELMEKVFRRLRAELVAGEPAGEYGKWSGYTSFIKEKVTTENGKVNLEFTYIYEEKADVTHITVGTPVVPGGV